MYNLGTYKQSFPPQLALFQLQHHLDKVMWAFLANLTLQMPTTK